MEEKKRDLTQEEPEKVSGGSGDPLWNVTCPSCGCPDPEVRGTDPSGRKTRCVCRACGHEFTVYNS